MQTSENLLWLIALPLFSSAILLLAGKRANSWGHVMGTIVSASTFTIGLVEFFAMQSRPEESRAVTQKSRTEDLLKMGLSLIIIKERVINIKCIIVLLFLLRSIIAGGE